MVQFTKLKLSGFKSFLYPTEIEIGPGKTGVVGPNGCGKSNLLEALGWVMGETSAKRLRGDAMDDVIFNGTNTKAARVSAEVTVVLDNSRKKAPAAFNHYDELEITRHIQRSAGSDYTINGKSVRAKDVQMLFADLVSGANSPALVSQGRITSIIQAKAKDRRRILEDAAGISGLHARRHEAELKLRATANNLERLEDIIGTMGTQLDSLKKQARLASRYKNLSDHIRNAEATVYHLKWWHQETNVKNIKTTFEETENKVREKLLQTTQLSTKQAEQAAILPELRKAEAETAAILQRYMIEKENIEHEEARLKQIIDNTKQEIAQLNQDIEQEKTILVEEKARFETLSHEHKELSGIEDNIDSLAAVEKQKLESVKEDLKRAEQSQQELTKALAQSEAEKANLQNQKIGLEGQLAKLENEKITLEERLNSIQLEMAEQTLFDDFKKTIEKLEEQLEKTREKRDSQEELKTDLELERTGLREEYQQEQTHLTKLFAEIHALEQILQENVEQSSAPVLQELSVQKGYERALAAALREDLNHSCDENALVYWSMLGDFKEEFSLPEKTIPLLQYVECPAVLNRALSQIGVVENKSSGQDMASKLKPGQILVTKEGDIWRWDGLTIKAEAPNSAALKLQQKNRLEELRLDGERIERVVKQKKDKLDIVDEKINKCTGTIQSLKIELIDTEKQQKETRDKLNSLQEEVSALANKKISAESSLSHIQDSIRNTQQQRVDVTQKLAQAHQEKDLFDQVNTIREEVDSLRESYNQQQLKYNQLLSESSYRKSRLSQIERDLHNTEQTQQRSLTRIEDYQQRLEKAQIRLKSTQNDPQRETSKRDDLLNKIEEYDQKRQEKANILQEAENTLRETELALRQAEKELSDLREKRATAQANYENLKTNLDSLRQEIFEKFESQPERLLENLGLAIDENDPPSLERTEQKLSKLIAERENMGPVNLRADIEAQELNTKIEELIKEKEELTSAIHKLRNAIGRLNKEARERLLEAFDKVDHHFQYLFTRLFGGGKAYLQLTDAEDPLDAGLEIFAQPPGKKLQNLSLLSGGEQTLTSIALVFGMFLTNPSPICVLDEIDAALDDANIDRVCALLDEMAKKGDTRFLVISHHRMTVARMDRLYGVTMAEKGISQLVSVDLSQPDLLDQPKMRDVA